MRKYEIFLNITNHSRFYTIFVHNTASNGKSWTWTQAKIRAGGFLPIGGVHTNSIKDGYVDGVLRIRKACGFMSEKLVIRMDEYTFVKICL